MRIDFDLMYIIKHPEWYTAEPGWPYKPTDKAPPEAVEAIKRANERIKEKYDRTK